MGIARSIKDSCSVKRRGIPTKSGWTNAATKTTLRAGRIGKHTSTKPSIGW